MPGRVHPWALTMATVMAAVAGCSSSTPEATSALPDAPPASTTATAHASTAPAPVTATTVSTVGTNSNLTATRWDWLPTIGYDAETLVIALRVGADAASWHAHRSGKNGPGPDLPLTVAAGALTLNLVPGTDPDADTIQFTGPDGTAVSVRLVRPGNGHGLGLDGLGRLTQTFAGGAVVPAILVLPRLEAEADRRWQTLRWLGGEPTFQCAQTLAAPVVPPGQSDLLALIASSQASDPSGKNLLVLLGPGDRLVGWNHRAYRQCLAWLVSDLGARSSGHLVIAGPLAPAPDAARVAPLRAQVDDVAAAYRCQVVQLGELANETWWQVAPGILGPQLNAAGVAEERRRLAPWLAAPATP